MYLRIVRTLVFPARFELCFSGLVCCVSPSVVGALPVIVSVAAPAPVFGTRFPRLPVLLLRYTGCAPGGPGWHRQEAFGLSALCSGRHYAASGQARNRQCCGC